MYISDYTLRANDVAKQLNWFSLTVCGAASQAQKQFYSIAWKDLPVHVRVHFHCVEDEYFRSESSFFYSLKVIPNWYRRLNLSRRLKVKFWLPRITIDCQKVISGKTKSLVFPIIYWSNFITFYCQLFFTRLHKAPETLNEPVRAPYATSIRSMFGKRMVVSMLSNSLGTCF